jgi:hypothetical protein
MKNPLSTAFLFYYNYSDYYTLLKQGVPGPGGNDTVLLAVTALNEDLHAVSEPFVNLGQHH